MNDLEQLKTLLFGAERQALESITERVQRPETRVVDVADILPEAVRLSHRQGSELVDNLREPVGECIKDSFREEPRAYADALYPVMGPAIRKSIMNALRAFAQQISDTVEQSVSTKGIRWRFEAWRAGVPFGEYVVQRTLQYRVEQAYLISRENGLLIGHSHHEASRIKDSDAVSAMFTAIQDFIKESFTPDRSGRLETADMGDFTLWAVHGPHALLVCVIRGVPPRSLRADLSAILERIHFRYGDAMRDYSGDTSTMPGVEEDLGDCLRFEALKVKATDKRWSKSFIVLIALAVAALAWFGFQNWQLGQQRQAIFAALDDAPGIYVSEVSRDGRRFAVRGLADPLAESVASIAVRAGVDPERITLELRPFQSLDGGIVLKRAVTRLRPPDTVTVESVGGGLALSGTATHSWIEFARMLAQSGSLGMTANLDNVVSADLVALFDAAREVETGNFFFADRAVFRDGGRQRLEDHANKLAGIVRSANQLGVDWRITVTGFTDAVGSLRFNEALAAERAGLAVSELERQGIDAARIETSADADPGEYEQANPERRRVSIGFELRDPDGSD